MDDFNEIKSLGGGRFSFWAGRQKYTVTTKLEPERFRAVAESVGHLVASFPPNLSQDERLVLALMTLAFRVDEMGARLDKLCADLSGGGEK